MDVRYRFDADFQRKILALAVRSEVLADAAGLLKPEFFGDPATGAPRFTIAKVLLDFAARYANEHPGAATMDMLIAGAAKRMRPEGRTALEEEWRCIRGIDIPDPAFVREKAVEWARMVAVTQAIVAAGKALAGAEAAEISDATMATILRDVDTAVGIGRTARRGLWWRESADYSYWVDDDDRRRIPTGLGPLDRGIRGGIAPGEVFVILAPPKGGKTTFLVNFAVGAAAAGKTVALFSYEMRSRVMRMRADRRLARRTREEIRVDLSVLGDAREAMDLAGAGDVWIEEAIAGEMTLGVVERRIEQLRATRDIDLVILDYLNIMLGGAGKYDREERHRLAELAQGMTVLAKRAGVAVWTAALVNRKAVKTTKIQKDDVAEAFKILAVVDGVIGICADDAMIALKLRNLYATALRDAEDEVFLGRYTVDLARQSVREADTFALVPSREDDSDDLSPDPPNIAKFRD